MYWLILKKDVHTCENEEIRHLLLHFIIISRHSTYRLHFRETDSRIEEAESNTIIYLKENYHDISEVTVTNTEKNPMGLLVLSGYLNNDKGKEFSVNYDFNQKDVISGGVDAEIK